MTVHFGVFFTPSCLQCRIEESDMGHQQNVSNYIYLEFYLVYQQGIPLKCPPSWSIFFKSSVFLYIMDWTDKITHLLVQTPSAHGAGVLESSKIRCGCSSNRFLLTTSKIIYGNPSHPCGFYINDFTLSLALCSYCFRLLRLRLRAR